IFDDGCRISCNNFAAWNDGFRFYKSQSTYDTFVAYYCIVHDDGVHSYQTISPDVCAVHNGTVTYMRSFLQRNRFTGKHVNRTIFLHVAAVLDNNPAPVSSNGSALPDIAVLPDDYIPGNCRQR